MDYGKVAKGILQYVGGKENVIFATHCVTRLRLTLKDCTKADTNKIKGIEGVLGVDSDFLNSPVSFINALQTLLTSCPIIT